PEREQMHPEIKKADQYALEAEIACFCHPLFREAMGVTESRDASDRPWLAGTKPKGWLPEQAEMAFLNEFEYLAEAEL
ncbi:MAG TPA: hypothetical protein VN085_02095, partial [Vicinamibacterales bacterium]|nr:hypothetical protein [Vicinamibacterales bacterium]